MVYSGLEFIKIEINSRKILIIKFVIVNDVFEISVNMMFFTIIFPVSF